MAKWDQKWTRRSDHGTRLPFRRSLVDASSLRSKAAERDEGTRPPLPWQKDLDAEEELRRAEKRQRGAAARDRGPHHEAEGQQGVEREVRAGVLPSCEEGEVGGTVAGSRGRRGAYWG